MREEYSRMEAGIQRRGTFDQALKDFKLRLSRLTNQAVDDSGRPAYEYVRIAALKKWLRQESTARVNRTDKKPVTNAELLLHAAYEGKNKYNFLPLSASAISGHNRNCYLAVFSILLDLGYGHYIDCFHRASLKDDYLHEISLDALKNKLAGHDIENREELALLFHERKWRFCPAFFTKDMDGEFCENRIIPICRAQYIASGATAAVWQVSVQAEFVDHSLRDAMKGDRSASYEDTDYGPVSKPSFSCASRVHLVRCLHHHLDSATPLRRKCSKSAIIGTSRARKKHSTASARPPV